MSELAPKLKPIKVSPEKLILDPNNPRLISRDEDIRVESEALDLLDQTINQMRQKDFKVDEIENSIKQNGWVPIDFIFVKKLDDQGRYLVLEGNRRVTAIRNLRNYKDTDQKLKESLNVIEVMEIIDDLPKDQLRKKIMYLLGVRHHGSLKPWTPFAQAHNIYLRYIEISKMNSEGFIWDKKVGQQIADALSVDLNDVLKRLKVYRVMEQIGNDEKIKESETNGNNGGIKDRYYSVIAEAIVQPKKYLKDYIHQDQTNFLLDDKSLDRIINLCHFEHSKRNGSPINDPTEWRSLEKILADQDEDKRIEMLRKVEEDKAPPSIVWAERSVELQKLQWDKWLSKVNTVLSRVNLGDDLQSEEAKVVTQRLLNILHSLDEKDQ